MSDMVKDKDEGKKTVSSDLLKKVKLLELRTRVQVRDVFGGKYQSIFKGQGMDFAEVREYIPGDDIRSIDWNVSARMDSPYVKIFREERELTILLMVDVSGSGNFGTQVSAADSKWQDKDLALVKREVAAELTALLALCALTNNDKVGLLLFSDTVEHFVAPKKGRKHILRLIRDVLAFEPQSKGTSISTAMEYALHALRKRAVVFMMSDFLDRGYENVVKVASRKHDVVALELFDPREREIPSVGMIPMRDNETGTIRWVNTSSAAVRKSFSDEARGWEAERRTFFKSISVDRVELPIDQPYFPPLVKFFRTRERRR